ncbi:hypothetical protein [Rubellicoccus peritrichatus]|uniref:Uncharacterized protein n=1 Tax=Rubellicoccus peritrichatus TaxID=3080537 RepID=A0AAQ3QTI2_9BACT|nr:hypothetical protein [Puniceicoccus sp. CR14]WOO43718.1 hypothetical protein RZN69_11520 [Puniceicoccus sp. CR14]
MIQFIFRYLTFQSTTEELNQLDRKHLIVGLIGVWIVGIGRYWDHPSASVAQYLGLGSVIYVFCLALVFWIIIKPLRVPQCTYINLLSLICLTSFPAILYAIPVERFTSISTAISLNVWFLAIVALWRVSLMFVYVRRAYQVSYWLCILILLLPIMGIVASLLILNLEQAVFEIMGGLRESEPEQTSNDGAYAVVFLLAALSYMGFIPILICYLITMVFRWQDRESVFKKDKIT